MVFALFKQVKQFHQGLFQTFIGCDYYTKSSALSFEKIFLLEIVKNSICLVGASKQNALFSKMYPKKRTHIPNVWNMLCSHKLVKLHSFCKELTNYFRSKTGLHNFIFFDQRFCLKPTTPKIYLRISTKKHISSLTCLFFLFKR